MRTQRISLFSVITCVALSLLGNNIASAQAYKVEADKPTFDDLQSPEYSGGKQKSFKPKDWLEIEVPLTVQMSPEPKSQTADSILVKWYVMVKNTEKSGTFHLLTKDVTHVNVPLNEEIFASIYLSPASLKRLTGSDRGGKNAVEAVGFEVLVNGQMKIQGTTKFSEGWWNSASDKISRNDSVPLLNKMETPFANHWWDRYAEIQIERR
ncbi:MAG: Amuc_1102 family pilus-like protein [Luteolibacter sp.]